MEKETVSIFWFRRDFRLHDNAGLYHALRENQKVLPVFIFDIEILCLLEDKNDIRVEFIFRCVEQMDNELKKMGSSLWVLYDSPLEAFKKITSREFLSQSNIEFNSYKDQVIFEKSEVTKDDGKPYTVFTPYMRKWKTKLLPFHIKPYPNEKYFSSFLKFTAPPVPSLEEMGFLLSGAVFPSNIIRENILRDYKLYRDFPAMEATSRISVHLRFGTVSIRELVGIALPLSDAWLNELIWREFYMMIIFHFPHSVNNSFKPEYDSIEWQNNTEQFERWCKGMTGYPIVDAGMRQLNETGFMHNRVRMITASFLVKHLLIDWRWGEAYFARKLLDFELSSNNGGWQWSASSGCDAAPYFRIFNPWEQTKKFDPDLKYIRKWVPEFEEFNYPKPIVDHKWARERVLNTYKKALNKVTENA
jgi:deoxyribodipyrimidine photo-lyase